MSVCFGTHPIQATALSRVLQQKANKQTKKKVISFSMYGTKDKYILGAYENAHLVKKYYPGWVCRFYYGPQVPKKVILALKELPHVELVPMNKNTNSVNASGMMWRFAPAFMDADVDVVIVRDTDSRLSKREVEAVNQWLASDNDFHIMRDHKNHQQYIMGGMWGARNGVLLALRDKYLNFFHNGRYGDDQKFLRDVVFPVIKKTATVHVGEDAPAYNKDPEKRAFPYPKDHGAFVGEVVLGGYTFWKNRKNIDS